MAIEFVEANPGSGGAGFAVDDITGGKVPYAKLMSGTDASEELIGGDAANGLDVDVTRVGGTVAVSNAGLTELAAAINGSSQMDVNIAASNATITVSSHAVTNAGTFAVQVDGAALTALQLIDNPVLVDDAAFTPATSSVMMAGFQADETATDSVNEGDAGAARMTLDRKLVVSNQAHSAGGALPYKSLDLDESEEEVKGTPGQVYGFIATNRRTSPLFLKFYNDTAANVIVGTTVPVMTIEIPANATDHTAMVTGFPVGVQFDAAITIAATTGFADNDTGAPGANELIINVFYK